MLLTWEEGGRTGKQLEHHQVWMLGPRVEMAGERCRSDFIFLLFAADVDAKWFGVLDVRLKELGVIAEQGCQRYRTVCCGSF